MVLLSWVHPLRWCFRGAFMDSHDAFVVLPWTPMGTMAFSWTQWCFHVYSHGSSGAFFASHDDFTDIHDASFVLSWAGGASLVLA